MEKETADRMISAYMKRLYGFAASKTYSFAEAEEIVVNPIFVEEEVAALEEYGYLDRQKDGRYLANIHITEPCLESEAQRVEINKRFAGRRKPSLRPGCGR